MYFFCLNLTLFFFLCRSPDGASVLTASSDRGVRLWDFPSLEHGKMAEWHPRTCFRALSSVRCVGWYPHYISRNFSTIDNQIRSETQSFADKLFAVASPCLPLALYRASDNSQHAAYITQDRHELVVGPTAFAFSPSGGTIYCGFDGWLSLFDVSRPGSIPLCRVQLSTKANQSLLIEDNCESEQNTLTIIESQSLSKNSKILDSTRTMKYRSKLGKKTQSRKKKLPVNAKQNGITSSICTLSESEFAISNYSGMIGLYDSRSLDALYVALGMRDAAPTHITFIPGTRKIVASMRRSGKVSCFDARVPNRPVWTYTRGFGTNQRTSVAYSPELSSIVAAACGSFGNEVHCISPTTGTRICDEINHGVYHNGVVSCCSFRGAWWVSCSGDKNKMKTTTTTRGDCHTERRVNEASLRLWHCTMSS
jgi:WD40 repeat protein